MREIVTERLVLRRFTAGDLPAFAAYRNDPEVARYQAWDVPYSRSEADRFLVAQQSVEFGGSGGWVQLAVVDRSDGRLAGDCAVRIVEDQPRTAELGVTFSRQAQGAGFAGEALTAVITRLFAEHALHRVYAETDERNRAAHRLFERLGFRCEARLIDADWCKGEWTTLRLFALLHHEWNS